MLGYGCGVSQYPQFFVEDLDIYHMLPRPYLRSFDGGTGDSCTEWSCTGATVHVTNIDLYIFPLNHHSLSWIQYIPRKYFCSVCQI